MKRIKKNIRKKKKLPGCKIIEMNSREIERMHQQTSYMGNTCCGQSHDDELPIFDEDAFGGKLDCEKITKKYKHK